MLYAVPVFAFPFCLLLAALNDAQRFKIPNELSVILFVTFLLSALTLQLETNLIISGLITGFTVLAVGIAVWSLGFCGAGDVKLIAAIAFWFGWPGLIPAMLMISAMGGLFCVLNIFVPRLLSRFPGLVSHSRLMSRIASAQVNTKSAHPYGLAITAGSLIAFPNSPIFEAILTRF